MRILSTVALICLVSISSGCKTNLTPKKVPFSIDEKTYFNWVGGMDNTRGTTIRITGFTQTTNLSFSKIYFQGHEYEVVPRFSGNDFVLESTRSEFHKRDQIMSSDPKAEYGNTAPPVGQEIPFELEDSEALLLYSVNGQESYHKVTGVKQLDTVYRP